MPNEISSHAYVICVLFLFNIIIIEALSIESATTVPPNVKNILDKANVPELQELLNGSRRILSGQKVTENRPYMVYLKLPRTNPKHRDYQHWLCGGVIVHEEYILTSAACIEDAKHFYVVSGTYKYHDEYSHKNPCIEHSAKKAIWKCIPRNYVFDGHENDNIRWMNNDIAIVKVEEEFDFARLVRGCDFIPQPIRYNNHSKQLENPGTECTVVGWGSTERYADKNGQSISQDLLEARVTILDKKPCKRRWGTRYHNIIDNYMICSRDNLRDLSDVCREKYAECTDVMYSDEGDDERRRVLHPTNLVLHSAYHNSTRRKLDSGGFCENDHGGPLIYGDGVDSIVIGIISACLVKEESNICYGPFLYTSVYKNRMLITCAIYKDIAGDCNKLFRSGDTFEETDMSWSDHPDGPAKNELRKSAKEGEQKRRSSFNTSQNFAKINVSSDKIIPHDGLVFRSDNKKET